MRIRGHRGAAALEPENTICSFRRALQEDVYAVEFDVRHTKDDELVVIHDETLDRTTNGVGPVKDYTLDQIQTLDAGAEEHVPTLQETLTYFSGQYDQFNELRLEVKEPDTAEDVYRRVKDSALLEKTVFHSFNTEILHELKRLNPDVRTSMAVEEPYKGLFEEAAAADCEIVAINYDHATHEALEEAREHGFNTDLWGIKEEDAIQEAYRLQPDYIGVDDPVLAKQVVKNMDEAYQDVEGYA